MCAYGGRGKGRENEREVSLWYRRPGRQTGGGGEGERGFKKNLITKRKIMRKGEESEKMEGGQSGDSERISSMWLLGKPQKSSFLSYSWGNTGEKGEATKGHWLSQGSVHDSVLCGSPRRTRKERHIQGILGDLCGLPFQIMSHHCSSFVEKKRHFPSLPAPATSL